MKLRLLTVCTLLAGPALAQTTPVNPLRIAITLPTDPNSDTYTFGAAQCSDTLTLAWSNTLVTSSFNQCSSNPFKIWSTAGECGDAPAAGDTRYDDVPWLTFTGIRSGTFTVKISELPDFKNPTTSDGGTPQTCGSPGEFTKTHRVCGLIEYSLSTGISCGTTNKQSATPLKLVYDTEPPSAPTINEYSAQDEAVRVTFTAPSDSAVVLLEVKGPMDADFRQIQEALASNSSIKGGGLQNNVDYEVQLRARDAAGNTSEPSAPVTVRPIKTLGFYGVYKDLGGTDQGCSVGVGLMPLLLTAFALRRQNRRRGGKRRTS